VTAGSVEETANANVRVGLPPADDRKSERERRRHEPLARRLEAALSKARILEIYLNVIEWGDGIWGAEAAARTYFGVPASGLTREQAALLAGAIINPRVLNPARPNRRLLARQRIVLGRMGGVEPPAPVPSPAPADEEATDELTPSADPTVPPTEEVPSPPDDSPYTPVPGPADGA
jgi:monofunctional biosynthetic peptidoglycan transglycosylase